MVRCKFVCNEVSEQHYAGGRRQWKYGFNAVYGQSGENKKFWEATPTGSLSFACMSLGAHPLFETGKEYYIDIHEAPAAVPAAS